MDYSPLAEKLNQQISSDSAVVFNMLSGYGRQLFFPKGIIAQSAEAGRLAHRYNATIGIATEGQEPMHLDTVAALLTGELKHKEVFPYAPSAGVEELRKKWQLRQKEHDTLIATSSLPVVTNALTHGLSLLGDMFLEPGDEVLLPDKYWGNYRLMWFVKNRAKLATFPLFTEDLQAFNRQAFHEKIMSSKVKKLFVLLNYPHNPTGYSLTQDDAASIKQSLCEKAQKGTELIVVCDDAYSGLQYEENCRKTSMFGELGQLHTNILAIKVDGCTKEHFMWGFRVGFLTFSHPDLTKKSYQALETKLGGAIRGGISNVSHLGQSILLKCLKSPQLDEQILAKKNIIKARYQRLKGIVKQSKYSDCWDVYPFNSGYFMCLKLKGVDAEKLRLYLLQEYGLGTISLGTTDLRVAFSCLEENQLENVFSLIAEGIAKISTN